MTATTTMSPQAKRFSSSSSTSPLTSSTSSPKKKQVTAFFLHSNSNHSYALRSTTSPTKRPRKPIEKFNVEAPIIKHKEIREGNGKALKTITHIRTAIKEAEAAGMHYHLRVLHNLMFGFSGSKNRVRNILNFSGYPSDVNRETKLKTMYKCGHLRYNNNYYIRLFLRFFGLATGGKKEELYERFLDFMFNPN